MADFDKARRNMVDSQIRAVEVRDSAVIEAMRAVPREVFVPDHLKGVAYVDEDLHVGGDRYVMEPMVLARLLQAARIGPGDTALAIGCTTGYAVALLARMAETVVGVERDPNFVATADRLLAELGVDNAAVVEGPLDEGYPRQAPYDVILIEGRCGEVPERITDQLAEGGRLVTALDERGVGKAVIMRRSGRAVGMRKLFDAHVPMLRGFERKPAFQF